MHLLLNVAAFKIGWVSSVVGAAQQMPWIGPVVVAIAVAVHLRFSPRPAAEMLLLAACALLGGLFDSLLVASGWVQYPSGLVSPLLAPYWIVGMWVLFATTLNVSLRWLKSRKVLAAMIGAISGPLSYVAGAGLGAIEFLDRATALMALAIGWAVILPLVLHIADLCDGDTVGNPAAGNLRGESA